MAVTPAVMDIKDAAVYLGTTVRHIRSLIERRQIPHSKMGGKLAFRVRELDQWLDDNAVHVRRR